MKVLFLTNVPSPYRVSFFNELGKWCDLTVLFEKTTSDERDVSWRKYQFVHFKGVVMDGKSIDTDSALCVSVVKYLKPGEYDHIIVSNFLSPTGMLAILWMRLKRMEYWLESDGGFAKDGKGLKEQLKKCFISGAKGYFSTAKEHDRYYMQYGAKKERLHRYPFTSLWQRDVCAAPVTVEERCALKEKYGISARWVLVAVGQFVPRKGFDLLLRAMAKLPKDNLVAVFVGGTPTQAYKKLIEEHRLKNVKFVEHVEKSAVLEYMRLADVFVHPTQEDIWGLVVNEAMAVGTPVITTDRCIAGLAMIKPEENGYIIPVDDLPALEAAIRKLLQKEDLSAMQWANLKTAAHYTIEAMVQRHLEILNE